MTLNNQRGFTLIELLIATSLLSLLMFTGSYAYSLFTNKWQSELGQFNQSNNEMMAFSRLQTLLNNISPYVIRQDNGEPAFFFIGNQDSILAITHDGLFEQDAAEAFRLSSIKTVDGKYKLLYQAKSLAKDFILTESQEIIFDKEITLIEGLDDVAINYFGWSSYLDKKSRTADNLVGEVKWYPTFSGIDKTITPGKNSPGINPRQRHG